MFGRHRVRAIAFYLPQFHPIPENDLWWGKGFTEWTNTARARPLFRRHYQPHIPADLGFYDLRVPEVREEQARIAEAHGIEGFCYYHYWFAGQRLLDRPLAEVTSSGSPNFPFCVCWANQTWSGIWHGAPNKILVEQTYPGAKDHEAHFQYLLPAFLDRRYIRVDEKPVFIVFMPKEITEPAATLRLWQEMARDNGLRGLYLVAYTHGPDADELRALGYDGVIRALNFKERRWSKDWRDPLARVSTAVRHRLGRPVIVPYSELVDECLALWRDGNQFPCVVHAFDNTPRSGRNGVVYMGSTPETFGRLLEGAAASLQGRRSEEQLLFLKSWNEWAEGNHLEPDQRFGMRYLETVRDVLTT